MMSYRGQPQGIGQKVGAGWTDLAVVEARGIDLEAGAKAGGREAETATAGGIEAEIGTGAQSTQKQPLPQPLRSR